jgi:hypothetical protein
VLRAPGRASLARAGGGTGVYGDSDAGFGVWGVGSKAAAVSVYGQGFAGVGVEGTSNGAGKAGVAGLHTNNDYGMVGISLQGSTFGSGIGLYGISGSGTGV